MEPSRLGPYVIRSRIGRGGMGAVYEAVDPATGAAVAIKTMAAHLGDDAALRRRFLAEIDALKALRHSGIVRLLAFGEEQGAPYFAMELVRGKSLEELLRSGRRFTWRQAVATGLEVSRALKAAHDHGVVHRDLKPANLLFPAEPADGITVKLADFGIARLFGDSSHTQAGSIVGTAEYMAPEQATGGPVDRRADLYALGLVMFAMVTGRPPFHGGQPLDIIDRQRHEVPPRLAALVPGVPAEFDELVARLLAKSPAERPASGLVLGRLLDAIVALHPPAADEPEPSGPAVPTSPVDLLADTQSMPGVRPSGSGPDVVAGGTTRGDFDPAAATFEPLTAAATVPMSIGEAGGERPRSRFITVEELDRATREADARRGRREAAVRSLAATIGLGLLVAGAAVLLRPLSADELHARIMAIAADDAADLRDARPLIDTFLDRHAADPRADAIRDLDRTLDLDALERRSRRRPRASRPVSPLERDYRAAIARESEGPSACAAALAGVLAVHAESPDPADPDHALWLALVRRQLDRLAPLVAAEQADDAARTAAALAEAAELATEATAADAARRADLLTRRRAILEGLVKVYAERPHAAGAVAEARRLLAAEPAPE
jgi:serine/threonine-protein kinase